MKTAVISDRLRGGDRVEVEFTLVADTPLSRLTRAD
jgi:hypothetical protein